MTQFSANLGFLWTDRPLPDAILAAKRAGFAAVECHWPYDTPAADVVTALTQTGLPMLALNTRPGLMESGEFGLSAVPGREQEARASITEAVGYAAEIGAGAVHVMAGQASGEEALTTFLGNLEFAAESVAGERDILIEPLNVHDAPGYFLGSSALARAIIESLGVPNMKLMFDCYHVARTEGDVVGRVRDLLPIIGHIQFASVPDRRAPDHGEIDYHKVFAAIRDLGWTKPLGAEYKPAGDTGASLGWMSEFGADG